MSQSGSNHLSDQPVYDPLAGDVDQAERLGDRLFLKSSIEVPLCFYASHRSSSGEIHAQKQRATE